MELFFPCDDDVDNDNDVDTADDDKNGQDTLTCIAMYTPAARCGSAPEFGCYTNHIKY